MIRRFPPPEVIVIQCREIVMNQRIGMNIFSGNRKGKDIMPISADSLSRRDYENRPQPLATGEDTVKHRFMDTFRISGFFR
jgi:hypothetical protein